MFLLPEMGKQLSKFNNWLQEQKSPAENRELGRNEMAPRVRCPMCLRSSEPGLYLALIKATS